MTAAAADHAERMDSMYRYQRHIYDLTRKYYLLGRDRAIRSLAARPRDTVLELGCGTGRNLTQVSRLYPQAQIFGLDISAEMLMSARKMLPEGTVLVAGDASSVAAADFGINGFDRILISYALSMIPAWEQTIEMAALALAHGGELHIIDFGQQEGLPRAFRRLLRAWLARFHVTPRERLEAVVCEVAARHGAEAFFQPLYRGYAWSATIRMPDITASA